MPLKANLNKSVMMLVLLLIMASPTLAEMLFPMHVGKQYVFEKWSNGDEANKWTVVMEFVDKFTVNSLDYYHLQIYNNDNDYAIDHYYVRSTEDTVYDYNPDGDDIIGFQEARVGTSWTSYEERDDGLNYSFAEIVAIERVTVPHGAFNKAYKIYKYRYDDIGNRSPEHYDWLVPGIGEVKEVDYWVESGPAPTTMELVSISSTLEDMMANALNYFYQSVTKGDLVGVGKGKGKKELKSLEETLKTASELIEEGYNGEACEQLSDALSRCDGDDNPPDYVSGSATSTLATMIQELIYELGCQ
jgi:hypothetical protein